MSINPSAFPRNELVQRSTWKDSTIADSFLALRSFRPLSERDAMDHCGYGCNHFRAAEEERRLVMDLTGFKMRSRLLHNLI